MMSDNKKNVANTNAESLPNGGVGSSALERSRSIRGSHVLQQDNGYLLQDFIRFCEMARINWTDAERTVIIGKIKRYYREANPCYIKSKNFKNIILLTTERIRSNVICAFIYIKELINELHAFKMRNRKNAAEGASVSHEGSAGSTDSRQDVQPSNRAKDLCSNSAKSETSSSEQVKDPCHSFLRVPLQPARESSPEIVCVDIEDDDEPTFYPSSKAGKSESGSKSCKIHDQKASEIMGGIPSVSKIVKEETSVDGKNALLVKNVKSETAEWKQNNEVNSCDDDTSDRRERHKKKLEKLMGKIDRKIRKLQRKELTYDDMDTESYYILEDKLKRRLMKVYQEWCRIVGLNPSRLGTKSEKTFHYEGSRYESINIAVEKFMNKKKIFPDFHDILNVVKTENSASNLYLSDSMCLKQAQEIFRDVGQELRGRRVYDFMECSGCYLTDEVNFDDDPAERDEQLRMQLDNNRKESEKKLNEILEKYVTEQDESKEKPVGVPDDAPTSSDEDDDEVEEEDDKEKSDTAIDVEGSSSRLGPINVEDSSSSGESDIFDGCFVDSAKSKKEGSPAVMSQNTTREVASKPSATASLSGSKNIGSCLAKPSTKANSFSAVTCTPISHIGGKDRLNSSQVSAFQSVKSSNCVTTNQNNKCTNNLGVHTKSDARNLNSGQPTASANYTSSATSLQNSFKNFNVQKLQKTIAMKFPDDDKTLKLKSSTSGNVAATQNGCKSAVTIPHKVQSKLRVPRADNEFTPKDSRNCVSSSSNIRQYASSGVVKHEAQTKVSGVKEKVKPKDTTISTTILQNSHRSVNSSPSCVKTESTSLYSNRQASVGNVSGPSNETEEIWLVSSSDSDASTEPTPEKKAAKKSSTNFKSVSQQPHFGVSGTRDLSGNSYMNSSRQSTNSNTQSALKGIKRVCSTPVRKQNIIPKKKVCLSSVPKS